MSNSVFIKEIFESIQGEGPYVGVNQLFIRFSNCNLSCKYCDTDFKSDLKKYTADELYEILNRHSSVHSVSLTGGEPLMETEFLCGFLKKVNKKIYLETNGTLYKNLEKIIDYIDIISMDIKLPSCSGMQGLYERHEKFIQVAMAHGKEIFLKIVFDENITGEEINRTIEIAKKNGLLVVLQPKTDKEVLNLTSDFINKVFYQYNRLYNNVRLIPQVHKFINVL